jgi:hypothetical protein
MCGAHDAILAVDQDWKAKGINIEGQENQYVREKKLRFLRLTISFHGVSDPVRNPNPVLSAATRRSP